MKRLISVLMILSLLLLTSCGGSDPAVVSTKDNDGKALKVRLADVWQDGEDRVMVSLKGLGPGTLLDEGVQPGTRIAMPHVKVRIQVGDEWLEKKEYPQGMFSREDKGSLTVRFDTTTLPAQVEIDGQAVPLEKVKLEGVDRQALLDAEAEVYRAREEAERQKAEAAQQRLDDARPVAPKTEPDLTWTNDISLAAGERLYWAATGLENAGSAVVSFVLSADGATAHTIRVDLAGGRAGNTLYNRQYTAMMSFPVEDGRLTVDNGEVLLDVVIDGDRAEGVFEYSVEGDAKDIFGRPTYTSLGIARVEMDSR